MIATFPTTRCRKAYFSFSAFYFSRHFSRQSVASDEMGIVMKGLLAVNLLSPSRSRYLGQLLTYAARLEVTAIVWIVKKLRALYCTVNPLIESLSNEIPGALFE